MPARFRKYFNKDLLRPTIYKAFSRFIYGLLLSLLWEHFISGPYLDRMHAFLFMGVFFAGAAWLAYLRLDGVKMPKKPDWIDSIARKAARGYGDMIDFVDEPVVTFEELEEDEKSFCLLAADLACCALFLILSFI